MSLQKDTAKGSDKKFIVIFTDLDGTLLDHVSYDWDEAKPALDVCRDLRIPVIMVSSKTRAELDIFRQEIGLPFPFISENGGGIFFPKEGSEKQPPGTVPTEDLWKGSIGAPYDILVTGLQEIRDELGLSLQGFSELSLEEISLLTGLDPKGSRLAAKREFDEPFIVLEDKHIDVDTLHDAAQKRGLMITRGGRFYHLHGKTDKGEAVKRIISWYKDSYERVFTIALGDSPNDFPMLKQVDQPVLIRSQQNFPGIEEEIPGLIITREPGPEGWNSAVLEILSKEKAEDIY